MCKIGYFTKTQADIEQPKGCILKSVSAEWMLHQSFKQPHPTAVYDTPFFHLLPPFPVINVSVFPITSSYEATALFPSSFYKRINIVFINHGSHLNQTYSLCLYVITNHIIFYPCFLFKLEVWKV